MLVETRPPAEQNEGDIDEFGLRVITEDQVGELLEWARQNYGQIAQAGPSALNNYRSEDEIRIGLKNKNVLWQDILLGGKRVGNIILSQQGQPPGTAMLGFVVSEDEQGKGLARRAITEVSRQAFEELNLHRLLAEVRREKKGQRSPVASANALYASGFRMIDYKPPTGRTIGEGSHRLDHIVLIFQKLNPQPDSGSGLDYSSISV